MVCAEVFQATLFYEWCLCFVSLVMCSALHRVSSMVFDSTLSDETGERVFDAALLDVSDLYVVADDLLQVALDCGLNVIACIGESLEMREADKTLEVCCNYTVFPCLLRLVCSADAFIPPMHLFRRCMCCAKTR